MAAPGAGSEQQSWVNRLHGQSAQTPPGLRPVSPLAGLAIMLVLIVVVVLIVVFAVVAIPVLIVAGLAIGGWRAVRALTVRKTNELLNRDGAGRHNVRVLRTAPDEASGRS